jgi:DNA-binding CsgD family transcriptional regulator
VIRRVLVYDRRVDALSTTIGEAARASTLDELGELAFPALARALDACPVFLARGDIDLRRARALAGEHRDALATYVRQYMPEDPLGRAAVAVDDPVNIMARHADPQAVRASRAWREFHRVHDFAHHLLVRFCGAQLASPHALAMGFTRGRNLREFGAREAAIAATALPAFRGAALRILRASEPVAPEVASVAARWGLTPAETLVLARLACGLTNAEIAARLHVSTETVRTHVARVLRKLGVSSRAKAAVLVQRLG